jgi:hypothetical protein
MKTVLAFLFLVFSLTASSQSSNICFNRPHSGFAEILIPVSQWQGTTVTLKSVDNNGWLALAPVTLSTSTLPKVTSASGVQYYYIKRSADYSNIDMVFEVSSAQDAAVSHLLPAIPQSQWNAAGTADICGVAKADVCFNRLHSGYAEMLIPVNQWHGTNVTVKAVDTNGWLALAPVTLSTSTLPKVTSASGVEYYYIKRSADYNNIDLVFEVSSPLDAAVSNLLPVLPQSQWNDFALQNTCFAKAKGICMNRNGAAYNIYLQKNQWNDITASLKIYNASGSLLFNQLYSSMPTVVNNGVLCYSISANYNANTNENLVVEVSSDKNAAFHMFLAPVQQLCYEAGSCTNPVTPAFTAVAPICKGTAFSLPASSGNGITGNWTPAINNQATTTYTFMPDAGQCANSIAMNVEVKTGLTWVSGSTNQTLNANTPLTNIVYTLGTGATGTTVTGLPTGVTFNINGSTLTISGTPSVAGVFHYAASTTTSCGADTAKGDIIVNAAAVDWTLAPNSYIFTGKDEKTGADVDGLYIPVKKAYAMWADDSNPELSLHTPIAAGSLTSAYVYWEDVSGIVKSAVNYKLDLTGSGEDAKIKVMIDKAKGEGNAIISFHAGPNGNNTDPIAWSWHVWITDNVAVNGSTYRQGFETDKNDVPFDQVTNRDGSPYKFQWMNRNLGATNAEFLGNDWNKSAGLMYQWGRKDPLPPMKYKDGTGYDINGAAGTFNTWQFTQNTTSPFGWMMRPYNNPNDHSEVAQNIGYSIKNPLKAITFLSQFGHWFSDQYYKIPNTDITKIVNWDLWSDNRKGKASKVNTSDVEMAKDTKSYELKSAYDPCPCNWRVPSHYGSIVAGDQSNLSSPWGRNVSWYNDDLTDSSMFYLNKSTYYLEKTKVYPSIGFDFGAQNDASDYRRNRNLGLFPITGAYVFMGPNEVGDYKRTTPSLEYINSLTTAPLPTATLSVYDNASGRGMGLTSDYFKLPTDNKYRLSVAQIAQAKGATPVRCMSDPNSKYLGNFETEFIAATDVIIKTDILDTLKKWTKDANSYIVMTNAATEKRINLRKAYAMYKLYTSENNQLSSGPTFSKCLLVNKCQSDKQRIDCRYGNRNK